MCIYVYVCMYISMYLSTEEKQFKFVTSNT